jgi:hypothetical protein
MLWHGCCYHACHVLVLCLQLESTLRASQREVRALDEALRAARGSEYEGLVKSTKAEEGG